VRDGGVCDVGWNGAIGVFGGHSMAFYGKDDVCMSAHGIYPGQLEFFVQL